MYVTRRLSELLKYPESLATKPDGPNSGFLVIKDFEAIETSTCCFKLSTSTTTRIKDIPFPQNKYLTLHYVKKIQTIKSDDKVETTYNTVSHPTIFIPVLNQPLSFNRYYLIVPNGPNKGKALHASNMPNTVCNPTTLDPRNVYQQVQFSPSTYGRHVPTSVAVGGYSPHYLSESVSWTLNGTDSDRFELDEVLGLDSKLRASFLSSLEILGRTLVGEWYVPFVFVKEGNMGVGEQVDRSLYYLMTLDMRWEKVFGCSKNENGNKNVVTVDVGVEKQRVYMAGNEAVWSEKHVMDKVIWFTSYGKEGGHSRVGLRVELFERMKWEQARGGWKFGGDEREGRVKRVEEFEGKDWKEFSCYVLVERFNLRRKDGHLAMSYDFKHIHQIKTVWK